MQILNSGRDVATRIDVHASVGASQVKLGHSTGEAHLNVVYVEGGGVLGEHEAPTPQLFIVQAFELEVAAPRLPVSPA